MTTFMVGGWGCLSAEAECMLTALAGVAAEDEERKQLAPDERVFGNKIEALKNMKKWKQCNPRMKTFQTKEDALYSTHNIVAEDENLLQLNGNASEGCPFKGLIAQELKKIKEAILAFRIERAYSQERILEPYLNQIYLGQCEVAVCEEGNSLNSINDFSFISPSTTPPPISSDF